MLKKSLKLFTILMIVGLLFTGAAAAVGITYNPNGATGAPKPGTVTAFADLEQDPVISFTWTAPEGTTFGGWATATATPIDETTFAYVVTDGSTIYAIWSKSDLTALTEAITAAKEEIDAFELDTEGMTAESIALAEAKLADLKEAAKEAVDALETIEAVEAYKFDASEAEELLVTELAAAKDAKKAAADALLEGLTEAEYTADSWKALTDAIAEDKDAIDDLATVEAVDEYELTATAAKESLVTKLATVTYDLNGGTGADAPKAVEYKTFTNIIVKSLPEGITNGEAVFVGWEDIKSTKLYLPGDVYRIGRTDAVTLKAVWSGETAPVDPVDPETPVQFVVSYVSGDNVMRFTVEEGAELEFPEEIFYKQGYKFTGWEIDGVAAEEGMIVESDLTLEAAYTELPILVEGNEKASIVDVIVLLQYTAKTGAIADKTVAEMVEAGFDFNGDGAINLIDVMMFLRSI